MKKIYFHVGLEKCGSTLIQAYMNEKSVHAALRERLGLRFNPHITITDFRNNPASHDQLRLSLFNPDRSENGMFATQEAFTWFTHKKDEPDRHVEMLEVLQDLTRDFEVHPILIVRRQDGFIQSLYNQLVKRGETREFRAFYADLPLERYDWNIVCGLYEKAFGGENLTVIPFEKRCHTGSPSANFLEGVLHAVGLADMKVDIEALPILNPSLAPRAVEVQRVANLFLQENESRWLAEQFEKYIPKLPGEKHTLILDEDIRELVGRYDQANRELFKRYMPLFDGTYYVGGN